MFWIEGIHTGKKEQVTEEQWAVLDKMFKNQFRKIPAPAAYSVEASKIIEDAGSTQNVNQDSATESE